jgi:hypothetical protein
MRYALLAVVWTFVLLSVASMIEFYAGWPLLLAGGALAGIIAVAYRRMHVAAHAVPASAQTRSSIGGEPHRV